MTRAAFSGLVMNSFSKSWRACSGSEPMSTRLACIRALRAMLVLMPPGCTVVADTPQRAMSSSSRRASVKPRTANLAAL